jgi:hypothetical protein
MMAKPLRRILPLSGDMATAVHEAGHAVVARAHGVEVKEVNLFRTRIRAGVTWWRRADAVWEAAFRLMAAGPLAEDMLRPGDSDAGRADLIHLERLLREAGEDSGKWSPRVVGLLAETMDLIEWHRAAIERTARLLLRRGRLTGDQVSAVMGPGP